MNDSKNQKIWMPAIIGVAILMLGILCIFTGKMFPCNSSSCVYSFTGYVLPLLGLGVIVPYGISLTVSGGTYYLFDKFILSKKRTGKDHPFLWSLLLSIILFYPVYALVNYVVVYLVLFKW